MIPSTKYELLSITEYCDNPSISIYVSPIHISNLEIQPGRIHLKHSLRLAAEQLHDLKYSRSETATFLQPAFDLLDNELAWHNNSRSLAVFLNPSVFHTYWLPISATDLVVVGTQFHIKPLIALMNHNEKFYVLGLSQNEVKLWEGSRSELHELQLEHIPHSLNEVISEFPEKQLLSRTSGSGQGRASVMFYSHDTRSDVLKNELVRFFREIDKGIAQLLRGESTPLILASVEYLIPIYKQVNTYPYLVDDSIVGNPEGLTSEAVHDQSWQIVQTYFDRPQNDALKRYFSLKQTGKATNKLAKIVNAAHHGQIEVLFVALDRQQWGIFNPESGTLRSHQQPVYGDVDLLDFASVHVLKHGGVIYARNVRQMPDNALAAAILRY